MKREEKATEAAAGGENETEMSERKSEANEVEANEIHDVSGDENFWREVRREFPVTETHAYLNSAGAGPVPRCALAAAMRFYQETLESGDARWDEWRARREAARRSIANLINAEPDEIGFTTNTSQGMNLIVDALEGAGDVVSCELEFPVSTIPWLHRGVAVHFVKPIEGEILIDDVLHEANGNAKIICLSHVQYSNGFRLDLETLGAAKGDRLFVVNASQSAGVFPIDVKRMRIDALSATGHKWALGGYGSGFVYISRRILEATRPRAVSWMSVEHPFAMRNREFVLKNDAAARSETGCPHFAGIFSLGASTEFIQSVGKERIERRALEINRLLTQRLDEAGWRVLSPLKDESARSAETLVAARDGARLTRFLGERNIAVTQKPEGFRAATHFFNDEADVERLIDALNAAREFRV